MPWDVRIISATYRSLEGEKGVVVELYGKTRDGHSAVVRYRGFDPWFHLIEPPPELLDDLKRDAGVKKIEEISLWHRGRDEAAGREKRGARVTVTYPYTVPDFRSRCGRFCEVAAADIPFGQRFMYDRDVGGCARVEGRLVEEGPVKDLYATELVIEAERLGPCEEFHPALKYLSFDIETSIRDGHIICLCCAVRDADGDLHEKRFSGTEKEIVDGFVRFIIRTDPDVITGYNIDNFDIPKLNERIKRGGLPPLRIGRDRSEVRAAGDRFWRATGRLIADAWWNARKRFRPKKETLQHLSELLLGDKKLDVDRLRMEEEWAANPERVLEYCYKDAELALRILEKTGVVTSGMDLATVARLPLDDVVNGRTSTLIDSILIRESDRNSIAVPLSRHEYGGQPIEGGYVHAIQPRLYHWVCVLDYKAMYPSVIIANNLCFTTLSPEGVVEAPETGLRFLSPERRKGILPGILQRLMKERDEAKRRKKEAAGAGNAEQADYYDGLQDAIKILMNSFYGVFASSFYRFTDKKIGASITAFARHNIKGVIEALEARGISALYSDTDSVFFQSPFWDREEEIGRDEVLRLTVGKGKEVAADFSHGATVLDFQRVFEPFFSHGKKKRYVGRTVWPNDEVVVRGYETRRTDTFDLMSDALNSVFERILSNDTEGAVEVSRRFVAETKKGHVGDVSRLVISRSFRGGDEGAYANPESQPQYRVAMMLKEMHREVIPGMKVSWIVTDGRKQPQEVRPFIDGVPFEGAPDWDYYARRIAEAVARVTEVFGWSEDALLRGNRQTTLIGLE